MRHKKRRILPFCISVLLCAGIPSPAHAEPGTVLHEQKVADAQGGFQGVLDNQDYFGRAVTSVGDLDLDGVEDIAVGADEDDDGGAGRGAVWILFLNSDGTVKSHQKISSTEGAFAGVLNNGDQFGFALASLGDLDDDGVNDIAVGARNDDDGNTGAGAVWILFLKPDGTVKAQQKISNLSGGFAGTLPSGDSFGFSVASLDDLNGDGITDLAVGAIGYSGQQGAVWILFLHADGTVGGQQKIADGLAGFTGGLASQDYFGSAVGALGDLDGDGAEDLGVGAPGDDDGGTGRGAVWVLFLNSNGTVKSGQKVSDTEGSFVGGLSDNDRFGAAITSIDDLSGDGIRELVVGADSDREVGSERGAVWILFLNLDGSVQGHQKINEVSGGFAGTLQDVARFGSSVASIGDLNGDGISDLSVGAASDNGNGGARGAIWNLFLDGIAASTTTSTTTTSTTTTVPDMPGTPSCGDVDGDGNKTATDALRALSVAVGLGSCELWVCDATGDGVNAATDALAILKSAVGLPIVMQCPSASGTTTTTVTTTTTLPAPVVYTLTIGKTGTGSGRVVSTNSAGIDCGEECSAVYPEGTDVNLAAIADAGSTFSGWSRCTGTGDCLVRMGRNKTVDATFDLVTTTTTTTTTTLPASPFIGTHSGRFKGDDYGVCTATVAANGAVNGDCYSLTLESSYSVSGTVAADGSFNATATTGASLTGRFKTDGTGSGSWNNETNSGTWTVFKHTGTTAYVGAYAGYYGGYDEGPVAFTVDNSRKISGFGFSYGLWAFFNGSGSVTTGGAVAVNASTGAQLTGTMTRSGSASGTWVNASVGGTWSASRLP